MMEVDVTCRFCYRRLGTPIKSYTDQFVNNNQPYFEFECKACRSTQYFGSTGRALHYWFEIGKYHLYFMTNGTFQCCNGRLGPIFELDYHPKLTPQNCTEERIKTLVLFS